MQATPRSPLVTQQLLLLLLLLGCAVALAAAGSGQDRHHHDTDDDGTGEHDSAYDQAQFLGKDAAKQFAGFDAKVSEEKLAQLIRNEVDANKDGWVSEEELLLRLEKVHREQQTDELDSYWKDLSPKGGKLDWEAHAKTLQPHFFDGRTDEVAKAAAMAVEEARKGVDVISVAVPEKAPADDREVLQEFFKELVRQRKRWVAADADKDGALSHEEYRSLLFPEDAPAMRSVVVSETMDQLDRDRDGRLSLAEYLAGQWTPNEPGEKEPHWLQEERDSFAKKDANGDGYLDRAEVQAWIQPPGKEGGYLLKEEAKHLMREADANRDGRLSLEEVLKHRELFAGSKATRYGEDVMDGPDGRDEL